MATAPSLTSAIEKAVETHKDEFSVEQDLSQVQLPSGDEKQKVEEKKEPELEQVDEDAVQGKVLIEALRDPARAAYVIDMLARQAGYTKADLKTQTDVKEAKADLTKILEEELGAELAFMAPKLGKALDRVLEKIKTAPTGENAEVADLRARVENRERQEVENEILDTHTKLSQEYFSKDDMPPEVAKALSTAMDQFPPADVSMKPSVYYRKIFSLIAGELGLQKKGAFAGRQDEKIARSREDSAARQLTSNQRGITPSINGNARKMTLDDAVKRAVAQLDETMKK
jgi:hypothetical protein